jgi:hypothetical protein
VTWEATEDRNQRRHFAFGYESRTTRETANSLKTSCVNQLGTGFGFALKDSRTSKVMAQFHCVAESLLFLAFSRNSLIRSSLRLIKTFSLARPLPS